ncbi:tRNA (adenosine(37)-N6)-dimethylallyltransferase MiaA [Pedobacter sp. LMG 31464]|uniref:tRNA dimethylallyltransferase n=1 Tax=Pedobacter planticolens TaxID=2679964 RepID=A0A923E447_9SPHI|nr:tRNA (adenosine(37)-N6)-dimethylallyltransferase MiaA [Pedobacter planticolens]MBB2147159.1 tRNA (adenosine(37)-N6)-dimethylallyltransferase MiaA [Pedobacter planticolens]
MPQKTLIVVVGPTAIGKTALAIELAQFYHSEVISADSRQFFKEMNIGTAKPSKEELAAAPHHFINSHSVQTLFSTGDFEVQALQLMEDLFKKHNILIVVGGSGLYIDAICKGLDDLPEIDFAIREKLNQQLANEGIEAIRTQLQELDPEYFAKVDQSNPQRMIRGLEVVLSTGKKLSSFLTSNKKERPFNIIKIGLNTDRALLYERINHRVDLMMEAGQLEEAESLLPYRQYNALNTVGYSELFDYLDGKTDLASAVAMIKQNTRRFAKRQLTWFRRDENTVWFEPNQIEDIIQYLTKFCHSEVRGF